MLTRGSVISPTATFVAAIVSIPFLYAAQVSAATAPAAGETEVVSELGPPSSVVSGPAQFHLEAGQANGQANVVLHLKGGLGLKIGSPTSKDATPTDFANLDGLANNVSASLTYLKYFLPSPADNADTEAKRTCEGFLGTGKCDQITTSEAFRNALLHDKKDLETLRKARLAWDHAFYGSALTWAMDLEAKAGYKSFEFFGANAKDTKEGRFSETASAAVAGIYGPGRFSLGVTYQRAYQDSTTNAQHCDAIPGQPTLQACKQLPFGAPPVTGSLVVRLELRHIFLGSEPFKTWGLCPLLSWDSKKQVFGVDMPVFLVTDSQQRLTGGIRAGWRSDQKHATVSGFVYTPISLF